MNKYELKSDETVTVSHEESIMKKVKRKQQAFGMLVKIFTIFIFFGGTLSFLMYFFLVGDKPNVTSSPSIIEEFIEENDNNNTKQNENIEFTIKQDEVKNQFEDPVYQYSTGMRSINGDGFSKNVTEGIKWLTLAANSNHTEAQLNLGVLYFNGKEIPQNYNQAIYWFDQASKNDNSEAQYFIGYMYEHGLGLAQSLDNAKNFYKIAALKGHQKSMEAFEKIKYKQREMSKIQIDNKEVEKYLDSINKQPKSRQQKYNVEIIIN